MGSRPTKLKLMAANNQTKLSDSIPNPLSVYVPFEALTEQLLKSVISVVCQRDHWHGGEGSDRPLLCFLLAINQKLEALEKEKPVDADSHAGRVRQWLVDSKGKPIGWKHLQEQFEQIYQPVKENSDRYKINDKRNLYYEMDVIPKLPHLRKSHQYMEKYRPQGFSPDELKVYWNYEQIAQLCQTTNPPHDPSDQDVIGNLQKHPVEQRVHSGRITYKTTGIEKVVFEVPESAQIILLNFANEQSPGGGYLRHAIAQEEVLLYNADGYRALLDLKYGRMAGGYAIPEFGLAYVRDIRVIDQNTDKARTADMLVSACYCLDYPQLYKNPQNFEEWYHNNLCKFRAFIAAAVANSKDDGSNTYLLLGPIGTGAFGNDTNEIARVFRDALNERMCGMQHPVRYAFENIWFVSIDGWKNDEFRKVIGEGEAPPPSTEESKEKSTASTAEVPFDPQPKVDAEPQPKADGGAEPKTEDDLEKATTEDK